MERKGVTGKEGLIRTYAVECVTHGLLGYVYSTRMGMILFEGHARLGDGTCEGPNIYLKTPQIIKPAQKFIPP